MHLKPPEKGDLKGIKCQKRSQEDQRRPKSRFRFKPLAGSKIPTMEAVKKKKKMKVHIKEMCMYTAVIKASDGLAGDDVASQAALWQ